MFFTQRMSRPIDFAAAVRQAARNMIHRDAPRKVDGVPDHMVRKVVISLVNELADQLTRDSGEFDRRAFLKFVEVPEDREPHPQVAEIVAMYRDDLVPLRQVAERFDLAYWEAREILVREGVMIRQPAPIKSRKRRPRKPRPSSAMVEDMRTMYRSGATLTMVGEEFGYHASSVAQWMREAGETIRKQGVKAWIA